jgi:hypothetical protein
LLAFGAQGGGERADLYYIGSSRRVHAIFVTASLRLAVRKFDIVIAKRERSPVGSFWEAFLEKFAS